MEHANMATDWLAVARAVEPMLARERDYGETHRQTSPEVIAALAEAGLFRLKLPAEYGGAEASFVTCFRVYEALAIADASAAWNVMITNEVKALSGYMVPSIGEEVFAANPDGFVGFAIMRRQAEVRRVQGGFELSGQWGYSSGALAARWFGALVPVQEGEASGAPNVYCLFMPASACEVVDTWNAVGLRGSGSHDIKTEQTFVPESRAMPMSQMQRHVAGRIFAGPPPLHLGGMAAVNLGIARVAIDSLLALGGKVPSGGPGVAFDGRCLADRDTFQGNIARAEALYRSARAFLYEALDHIDQRQGRGEEPSATDLALKNLAAVHTAHACAQAVDLCFTTAGSNAVVPSSRLERCCRDILTSKQHGATSIFRYEDLGKFFIKAAGL